MKIKDIKKDTILFGCSFNVQLNKIELKDFEIYISEDDVGYELDNTAFINLKMIIPSGSIFIPFPNTNIDLDNIYAVLYDDNPFDLEEQYVWYYSANEDLITKFAKTINKKLAPKEYYCYRSKEFKPFKKMWK